MTYIPPFWPCFLGLAVPWAVAMWFIIGRKPASYYLRKRP